jgi:DNA-binding beta-propeller fold protein YncE
MKRCLTLCIFGIALFGAISAINLIAQAPVAPATDAGGLTPQQLSSRAKAYQAPQIPIESVPNFIKLPAGMYLGESMGVATNSKGHIFVFNRNGESSRLYEFDQTGAFVHEIGRNSYAFAMAHAVRVDAQDNIWTVDEGTNTVVRWNATDQRPDLIIGRRHEFVEGLIPTALPTPPAQHNGFNRPTDIAWDKAGNIFIADGYNNSRAIKFDRNGRFVAEVGVRGSEPTQMNTPHSIQVDNDGNVYVADRGNNRIQVFDNNLKLKTMYTDVGSPWAVCITPGPHQYLYSSNSFPDSSPANMRPVTGEIYKMELDGKVLGRFGRAGKALGEFSTTHAMDCRNENTMYVAEIAAWRVQKVILKPAAGQVSGGVR